MVPLPRRWALILARLLSAARNLYRPVQDALLGAFRHGRHCVEFIHDRQVIDNIVTVFEHAAQTLPDDDGDFVGKGRVVGLYGGVAVGQHVAVAVLMLQAFTGQRGAPGSGAQQKTARLGIARGPDQIADALEAEHGIEEEKRNHVDAEGGVGRAGGDEGRHRTGLGDAFFENLSVFGLLVVKQAFLVHRFVVLPDVRVDADLAKQAPPCRTCAPRRVRWARCTGPDLFVA